METWLVTMEGPGVAGEKYLLENWAESVWAVIQCNPMYMTFLSKTRCVWRLAFLFGSTESVCRLKNDSGKWRLNQETQTASRWGVWLGHKTFILVFLDCFPSEWSQMVSLLISIDLSEGHSVRWVKYPNPDRRIPAKPPLVSLASSPGGKFCRETLDERWRGQIGPRGSDLFLWLPSS